MTGRTCTSNPGGISIRATNPLGLQNLALGGAFSGTGTGVGAAVAVNVLTITTKATIGNDADVDATGAISIAAESSLKSLDVFAEDVPLLGNITAMSVAVGGALSGGSAAVGGSVLVDVFTITTQASIGTSARINRDVTPGAGQDISVTATDTTEISSGAGGLGGSLGSAGVGAGIVVEVITKDVRAFIGQGADATAAGNVTITATSSEDILMIVASAGASSTAGVSASIVVVVLTVGARAYIESAAGTGTASTVLAGGDMTITASDTADKIELIAGGAAFGGSAGVGVSIVVFVKTTTVRAFIGLDDDPGHRPGPRRTRPRPRARASRRGARPASP